MILFGIIVTQISNCERNVEKILCIYNCLGCYTGLCVIVCVCVCVCVCVFVCVCVCVCVDVMLEILHEVPLFF